MTIPGGYILQPRCIDDSEIMQEPPVVRELWTYLLRRVNYKDNGKYSRGSAFFNLGEIQNILCWYQGWRKRYYSKPQLQKSLRKLYERNMIATQKATRGIYVTVLNYDYYQNPSNYESNGEDSQPGNSYESNDEGNDERNASAPQKTAHDKASEDNEEHGTQHRKQQRKSSNGTAKNKNGKKEEEGRERGGGPPERFLTMATNYYSHLQTIFPNRKIQAGSEKIKRGADVLRKLEELDGFQLDKDVRPALQWALADDFWHTRVLSLAELRKKAQGNENHKFFNLYQQYMAQSETRQPNDEVAL